MEKKYIVQVFDLSTNEWYNSSQMNWDKAIKEGYSQVCSLVDCWNNNTNNKPIGGCSPNEFNDAMENGQNWVVAHHVVGITDVTPSEPEVKYKDVVVIISGVGMDDGDIKAIQMPFDNYDFFKGYMKRVVELLGGKYNVYSLEEFDMLYNGSDTDYTKWKYIIHTKIAK